MGETVEEIRAYLRERGGQEGAQIADMIVPLRAIDAGTVLPNGDPCQVKPAGGGWIFTCRHFDMCTGNCGIYSTRPRFMCGQFPYGKPCEHGERCEWDLGRAGHWPMTFKMWSTVGYLPVRRWHLRVVQPNGRPSQEDALPLPQMIKHTAA